MLDPSSSEEESETETNEDENSDGHSVHKNLKKVQIDKKILRRDRAISYISI